MPTNPLEELQKTLESSGLAAYLVPLNDAFQGEYVPAFTRRLEWLTGFTGSNGIAVVTKHKAAFFTDGRYTLQAKQQVSEAFQHYNLADMTPWEWVAAQLTPNEALGYDPWLHTKKNLQHYEKLGITLKATLNLIDGLWQNRPLPPAAPATIHPLEYAGEDSRIKRQKLAEYLQAKQVDALLLTAPDSICWLLNIRGNDVPHTPFLLCYALVHNDASVQLFVDPVKIPDAVRKHLGEGVGVVLPDALEESINKLKNIQIDPNHASVWFFSTTPRIHEADDPCQLWKSRKNPIEIKGMKTCHIRDGAALTKFLYWLEEQEGLTEISAAKKLAQLRAQNDLFQDLSFDTISGFGSNGAIVHYRASEESSKRITGNGLYLLDSGGQYLDGTTDVTRTIAIGIPTEEQKHAFTRVLKGHIALAMAVFPEGTTGSQLDAIARYPLWQAGLDYDHGTGHGVGSYLSVHEGPQRISKAANSVALQPGMVVSNEPGYYKEGEYGIRIESLVLVVEKMEKHGKRFFGFETLTQVPLDMRLVDKDLLSETEWEWLAGYHQQVEKALARYLNGEEMAWLREYCKA